MVGLDEMGTYIFWFILGLALGCGIGIGCFYYLLYRKTERQVSKQVRYFNLLIKWLTLKCAGVALKDYFVVKGYKQIAVYGIGQVGKCFIDEMWNTEIEIKYLIDRNYMRMDEWVKTYAPEDELPEVDVIVVAIATSKYEYGLINSALSSRKAHNVMTLEDIIGELYSKR